MNKIAIVLSAFGALLLTSGQLQALTEKQVSHFDAETLEVKSAKEDTLSTSITLDINSKILSENRKVLVHLPEGYKDSNKTYPVLYVLDGNRHFPHARLSTQILQQQNLVPDMIIVAITNNRGTRTRDLSAEQLTFNQFITDELFPIIQLRFRASEIRTLFGHSMAGYFATNVLAKSPAMFDNYISASPVFQINDRHIVKAFKQLQLPNSLKRSLYFTLTDAVVEGKAAGDAMAEFVDSLSLSSPKGLNWKYDFIPNQVHMTTPYVTLYEGLTFVFSDFQAPKIASLDDYNKIGGLAGINAHYKQRAIKYGVPPVVPERTIRRIGFTLLDQGHAEDALTLLKTNVADNPNSLRALNALASTYEELNQVNKAIKTYNQALVLAKQQSSPAQQHFQTQLKRLTDA